MKFSDGQRQKEKQRWKSDFRLFLSFDADTVMQIASCFLAVLFQMIIFHHFSQKVRLILQFCQFCRTVIGNHGIYQIKH